MSLQGYNFNEILMFYLHLQLSLNIDTVYGLNQKNRICEKPMEKHHKYINKHVNKNRNGFRDVFVPLCVIFIEIGL